MKSTIFRDETGSVSLAHVILLFVTLLLGGAAVDVSDALFARKELRSAADAAALAAAAELPDADAARTAALAYMEKNLTPDDHGAVVFHAEIRIGNWDADRGAFIEDATSAAAVQVVARQANHVGYASLLQSTLLWIAGSEEWTVTAESTAVKPDGCPGPQDARTPSYCAAGAYSNAVLMN